MALMLCQRWPPFAEIDAKSRSEAELRERSRYKEARRALLRLFFMPQTHSASSAKAIKGVRFNEKKRKD